MSGLLPSFQVLVVFSAFLNKSALSSRPRNGDRMKAPFLLVWLGHPHIQPDPGPSPLPHFDAPFDGFGCSCHPNGGGRGNLLILSHPFWNGKPLRQWPARNWEAQTGRLSELPLSYVLKKNTFRVRLYSSRRVIDEPTAIFT